MAVNKNFVVKNGLEVAVDAITVDASSKRVGLGTTNPRDTLDVRGGIEATTIEVQDTVHVGTSGSVFYANNTTSNVGIGTSVPQYTLEVRGPVSTGATALYVYGDARVTGDLFLDDITIDNATVQNLTVLGNTGIFGDLTVSGVINNVISGLSSEGNYVGTGATILDFKTTSGNNITDLTIGSGIATVTIAPGVSLGLAIALGG
tara:strand:+ start:664 stop:1275 length:612 start_codon:yes stop_codon:yes gene_type:complete